MCTAAYILGEYGRLIRAEVPPAEQYRLLHGAFPAASQPTKGLLMTALLKVRCGTQQQLATSVLQRPLGTLSTRILSSRLAASIAQSDSCRIAACPLPYDARSTC